MKNKEFPTKKDLVYWLVGVLLILAVVIVWRTKDPSLLLDEISLGGTIISIVLALVAIFFTFIQSSESSRQSSNMIKQINKLTAQIINLSAMNEQLTNSLSTKDITYGKAVDNLIKQSEDQNKVTNILWDASTKLNVETEGSLSNDVAASITVNSPLQEKAIENFLRYKYENNDGFISIQVIWKDLFDNKLNIPMESLKYILNKLSEEGITKIKDLPEGYYV